MIYVRTCQKCGCTDDKACIEDFGVTARKYAPCHWVGPTHCSACFPEVDQAGLCQEHQPSHPGVAAHFTLITPETCPICRLIPQGGAHAGFFGEV